MVQNMPKEEVVVNVFKLFDYGTFLDDKIRIEKGYSYGFKFPGGARGGGTSNFQQLEGEIIDIKKRYNIGEIRTPVAMERDEFGGRLPIKPEELEILRRLIGKCA